MPKHNLYSAFLTRIQEICLALIESIDNFDQLLGEAFARKG